ITSFVVTRPRACGGRWRNWDHCDAHHGSNLASLPVWCQQQRSSDSHCGCVPAGDGEPVCLLVARAPRRASQSNAGVEVRMKKEECRMKNSKSSLCNVCPSAHFSAFFILPSSFLYE